MNFNKTCERKSVFDIFETPFFHSLTPSDTCLLLHRNEKTYLDCFVIGEYKTHIFKITSLLICFSIKIYITANKIHSTNVPLIMSERYNMPMRRTNLNQSLYSPSSPTESDEAHQRRLQWLRSQTTSSRRTYSDRNEEELDYHKRYIHSLFIDDEVMLPPPRAYRRQDHLNEYATWLLGRTLTILCEMEDSNNRQEDGFSDDWEDLNTIFRDWKNRCYERARRRHRNVRYRPY